MIYEGFSLTLPEWEERLFLVEYDWISRYKQYDPDDRLSSAEVLRMLLELYDSFDDSEEFRDFVRRIYGINLQ